MIELYSIRDVARILASLVRQETRAGSARMARRVVGELGRDLPLLQNPARHAGFTHYCTFTKRKRTSHPL